MPSWRHLLSIALAVSPWTLPAQGPIVARTPHLWIRLQQPLASDRARAGDEIRAVVIAAEDMVAPQGAVVSGQIVEAKPRSGPNGRSFLRLAFREIEAFGRRWPLHAKLVEVDNARETVGPDSLIIGPGGLRKRPTKWDLVFAPLVYTHPVSLGILQGYKFVWSEIKRPQIRYRSGVEMLLALEEPPPFPESLEFIPAVSRLDNMVPTGWDSLVASLPKRIESVNPPQPSDWTNVVVAGDRASVEHAFREAGWYTADKMCVKAAFKAGYAIVKRRPYNRAPVSPMTLGGRLPDLVFQKQNNTFAKRHHIRLWKMKDSWQGLEIWVGAASHDVGIEYSKITRSYTHKIQARIDREREKVLNDLDFTGLAERRFLVARSGVP
ncbi:MAG: LssY C-terminal domain-containing protein, partial [Bryobacteraceae bacterium]